MQNIEQQLIALAQQELGVAPGLITTSTRLSEHGDSLDWLNLMLEVEKTFDVEISHEQSLSISTLDDLIELLQPSRIRSSSPACHVTQPCGTSIR